MMVGNLPSLKDRRLLRSASLTCPSCDQIDRVRKATAILGDEAVAGSGYERATATQTGAMLKGFRPPPAPRWHEPWGAGAVITAAVCFLVAAVGFVGFVRGS